MAMLDDAAADLRQTVAALQRELDQRTAERDEALAQWAATSEILGVVSRSPTDVQPVFEAIVGRAAALCDAGFSAVARLENGLLHLVTVHSMSAEETAAFHSLFPRAPTRNFTMGRAFVDARPVHFEDVLSEFDYDPRTIELLQSVAKYRSFLGVPILREGKPIGVIGCGRREVKPFTSAQIELVKTFADQAAIAIENVRLFGELDARNRDLGEALEQQTATAEVLQVINSSPGNLTPVFDAILEKAHGLCGVASGSLQIYDGEKFRAVATHGLPEPFADWLRRSHPGPNVRRLLDEGFVHYVDLAAIDNPLARTIVELGGIRTTLHLALRKDGALLGQIVAARQEVRPFAEKDIALLQNFAAQAVIAMENARLITETREALEQQTATAEVLQVINSSPSDLTPVFEALLDKATTLCDAAFGILWTYDGQRFYPVALHRTPPAFAAFLQAHQLTGFAGAAGRAGLGAMLDDKPFQLLLDAADSDLYRSRISPLNIAFVELGGARSGLIVPLRREGKLLGAIRLFRQEIRPFNDKEIALLQNFAAQAVIAMENARLLTETREALEQQTATAEILQVINSSPANLHPVFEAILEKAHTLGGASRGTLFLFDGEVFRAAASQGYPEGPPERMRRGITVSEDPRLAALLAGERLIHVPDLMQLDDPIARAVTERGGVRTNLLLPLRKDDALLGVLSCNRAEVRPFSDKQIALLESFAAQAVIAMDNARLLNEIRQRQAELRVTFDNMGDGVAMFDGELRLAAWNRNFQHMLDLPDALLAERPTYADYVRALAERGEFGSGDIEAELSRRLAETDQELRLERTRPDGRIIEVRRNAVPGGGFVLIYGDITERRRAEEEIRAARDTAEATLRELRAAQANLIQAEKMASLGQLTAGIAHEIKNPLNFVNNFAGLSVELLDELKETAAPAIAGLAEDQRADIDEIVAMLTGNLEKIAEHGRRADGIVKSMLEHSRGGSGERREVDLNGLVEEALNLAYHGARAQDQSFNITLERELDHALAPVELAPQDITRVFLNLFGNGFYAAVKRQRDGAAPDFRPVLKVATLDRSDAVEIRIRDNGAGIPPEIRDKLFQPFFTTKPTGEGTGLGLSISWDIVTQQHGGTMTVDSVPGEYTEFTIRLPRSRQAATAAAAALASYP